jgi:hypothetical protein
MGMILFILEKYYLLKKILRKNEMRNLIGVGGMT